jgi:hypothetical protein
MNTKHANGCQCCECAPTPDMVERFHRADRFDHTPQERTGRSLAPEIDHNELGPSCHLDSARGDVARHGGHLGTGSDSVKDAGTSIASGARAPRVNWGPLSRIRSGKRV